MKNGADREKEGGRPQEKGRRIQAGPNLTSWAEKEKRGRKGKENLFYFSKPFPNHIFKYFFIYLNLALNQKSNAAA
jgi:hypothetical protein